MYQKQNKPGEYEQMPRANVAELTQPLTRQEDDSLASLILKILSEKYLVQVPEWVKTYPIPEGTKPSQMGCARCWMMCLKKKKELKIDDHPVHTIDTLLMSSTIELVGDKISYVDEKKKKVELESVRGYHSINSSNRLLVTIAAHVADTIAYYTRVGKSGVEPTVTSEAEANYFFFNVHCAMYRKLTAPNIQSESVARDVIFTWAMNNIDQAIIMCNNLCMQNKTYAKKSEEALAAYYQLRRNDMKTTEINDVLMPYPASQPKISMPDMDKVFKYLEDSRKIRGDNNGIGRLSIGYVGYLTTRTVVKNLTTFLNIRQLCLRYDVRVVMLVGTIPEFVRRMCIINGISLIDNLSLESTTLSYDVYKKGTAGIFSSILKGVPYGIYYTVKTVPPTIKNDVVEYLPINIGHLFEGAHVRGTVRFRATTIHFHKRMLGKDAEFSRVAFLPTALPHNGMCIVAFPKSTNIPILDLVSRCAYSNSIRNNILVVRRFWMHLDKYSTECGYFIPCKMPKNLTKDQKVARDYKMYEDGVTGDVAVLDEAPMTYDKRFTERKGVEPSVDDLVLEVVNFLKQTADVPSAIISLFRYWESSPPIVLAPLRRMMTEEEAVIKVAKAYEKNEHMIMAAYGDLKKMRLKAKDVPPPAKPPGEDIPEKAPDLQDIEVREADNYSDLDD